MLGQTRPKIIFCESKNIERIRSSLIEINHESRLFTFDQKLNDAEFVDDLFTPNGNDLSFNSPEIQDPANYIGIIACSSGTTGASKGVSMTHKTLISTLQHL